MAGFRTRPSVYISVRSAFHETGFGYANTWSNPAWELLEKPCGDTHESIKPGATIRRNHEGEGHSAVGGKDCNVCDILCDILSCI